MRDDGAMVILSFGVAREDERARERMPGRCARDRTIGLCPTSPRAAIVDARPSERATNARVRWTDDDDFALFIRSRAQLPDEAELTWDAGDAHPEPALDNLPPHIVTKNTAAMYLMGGFAVLGGVYATAVAVDKPSKVPFAPKTFPYDGLAVELGRKTA